MTPARIQWAAQKTSIITDRAEAVDGKMTGGRKKSDRRTSGRRRGRGVESVECEGRGRERDWPQI